MQVQVALVCRTQHVVRLVRPDLLVRLRSCIQNTLFLAHTVGTISQRGLCDRERLSAEALDGASRRGTGVDSIGRGLPPVSAARAYLGHCFAALTRFCKD
jgi:hypothetical protein